MEETQPTKIAPNGNQTNRNGFTSNNHQTHLETNETTEPRNTGGKKEKEELFKVIEKIRNTSIQESTNEQWPSKTHQREKRMTTVKKPRPPFKATQWTYQQKSFETNRGATEVRYIQMGHASHVQEKKEWNLERR